MKPWVPSVSLLSSVVRLLLLALLATSPLEAATRRFTGLGDRSSWTDPANWEGNVVPGPDDHALLLNGLGNRAIQVSGADVTVGSIEVRQRLEVRDATLTVAGGIEIAAQTIVLENAIVFGGITHRSGTFMGMRFEGDSSLVTEPIDVEAIDLEGNLPPDTTLILRGAPTGSLFWQTGKTNFGTIRFAPTTGQSAEINAGVTNEIPVINEASGTIEVLPGFGESRLAAHLINRGTIRVAAGTGWLMPRTSRLSTPLRFTMEAGQFLTEGDGYAELRAGQFEVFGGTISGQFRITEGSTFRSGPGAINVGTVIAAKGENYLLAHESPGITLSAFASLFDNISTLVVATNAAVNRGAIELDCSFPFLGSAIRCDAPLTNGPGGHITTRVGAGGGRTFRGTLINAGLISAPAEAPLDFQGTYTGAGGRVSGDVNFSNTSFYFAEPATEAHTLRVLGPNQLESDVTPGHELWMRAELFPGNASLRIGRDLTNHGTLRLESGGFGLASLLTAPQGDQTPTLTIAPSGEIKVRASTGGARQIQSHLVNRGRLNVGPGTVLLLNRTAGPDVRFESGEVSVDPTGLLQLLSPRFALAGGSVTGPVELVDARIDVEPSATQPAKLIALGSGTELIRLASRDVTVAVEGRNSHGPATARIAAPFANLGTIELTSNFGAQDSVLACDEPLVNAPGGRILASFGNGGRRTVQGAFVNRGQIEAGPDSALTFVGTYEGAGGTAAGQILFRGARLRFTAPAPGLHTLILDAETNTLTGNITANHELWIRSSTLGHSRLVVEGSVTNRGQLRLESVGGNWHCSMVSAPTNSSNPASSRLVNALEGRLIARAGTGGLRTVGVDLLNRGEVITEGPTKLDLGSASSIRFEQGSVAPGVDGRVRVLDSALEIAGGTLSGNVAAIRSRIATASSFTGPGTLFIHGEGNELVDSQSAGLSLRVEGNGEYLHARLRVRTNVTHRGALHLRTTSGGWASELLVDESATLGNAIGARIQADTGSTGPTRVWGRVRNAGLLAAEAGATLDFSGTYTGTGGTASGLVRMMATTLDFLQPPSAATRLTLVGAGNRLVSDHPANSELEVLSTQGQGRSVLAVSGSRTNRGTLRFTAEPGSPHETLLQSDRAPGFVNASDGIIVLDAGGGGMRRIQTSLDNRGTVEIGGPVAASAAWINASGATLRIAGGPRSLSLPGRMFSNAGRLEFASANTSFEVNGDGTFTPESEWALPLNPSSPTPRLRFTGDIALAGRLALSATGGVPFPDTASFGLVRAADRSGTFTAVTGAPPAGDGSLGTVYRANGVDLAARDGAAPEPPTITQQPTDAFAAVGVTVRFQVAATGPAPMTYQWFRGNNPIPGATLPEYSFVAARNLAVRYRVDVTGPGGTTTSDPARLIVPDAEIAASAATRTNVPYFDGDGLGMEIFHRAPAGTVAPELFNGLAPTERTRARVVDFPDNTDVVDISATYDEFLGGSAIVPESLANETIRSVALRLTGFLVISKEADLNPSTPAIDVEFAVASADGFHLTVGGAVLATSGNRNFDVTTRAVAFASEGVYPVSLLFAAESGGTSGLEFRWRTALSSIEELIPSRYLFPDPPGFSAPPIISPIASKTVREQTELSFVVQASDPDPGQSVRFALVAPVPDGASIDPITGRFRWTPDELAGPGEHPIRVEVRDDGEPPAAARERFTVTVQEVNRAPQPTPMTVRFVEPGQRLAIRIPFTDPDVPVQPLTQSLASGPEDARVTADGFFEWTMPPDATGERTILVRAVDPAGLSATNTLVLRVEQPKPNLTISRVVLATNAVGTGQRLAVTFREANNGRAIAAGPWRHRLLLSTDNTPDDGDVVLEDYVFRAALPPGQFFERGVQVRMPEVPGTYRLLAVSDADNAVNESAEDDNVTVAGPITVLTDYTATVSTEVTSAAAGTVIPLRGEARRRDGSAAGGVGVNVVLTVRGLTRTLFTLTDPAGGFLLNFTPLPNEAGDYQVAAGHPGETELPVQDTFRLFGMRATPDTASLTVPTDGRTTNRIELVNLGELGLTGIRSEVTGLPPGVTLDVRIPAILSPNGRAFVELIGSAGDVQPGRGPLTVRFVSAQGPVALLDLTLSVVSDSPRLVAEPAILNAGVLRGGQTLVPLVIRNSGAVTSGVVQIALPGLDWVTVVEPLPRPALAPGAATRIHLRLAPPSNTPPVDITGSIIARESGGRSTSIPFNFTLLSNDRVPLVVIAEDEYTYYAPGAPLLANAAVEVRRASSGELVAEGTTDASGRFQTAPIPEGYYEIAARADRHRPAAISHLVRAGSTNSVRAFLSREAVQTYFTVDPTSIDELSRVTIESVFETAVPMPVITVDPGYVDLRLLTERCTWIEVEVRNHGLIAAQNLRFETRSDGDWKLVPLLTHLGNLAGRTSVRVPFLIQRGTNPCPISILDPDPNEPSDPGNPGDNGDDDGSTAGTDPDPGDGGDDDSDGSGNRNPAPPYVPPGFGGCPGAAVAWDLECGGLRRTYYASIQFPSGCGNERFVGSGGGGGTGSEGYGTILGQQEPQPCDPCAAEMGKAGLLCAIGLTPLGPWTGCFRDVGGCAYAYYTGSFDYFGCAGAAVSCFDAGARTSLGPLSTLLSALSCVKGLKDTIDSCDAALGGSGLGLEPRRGAAPAGDVGLVFPGAAAVEKQYHRINAMVGPLFYLFPDPGFLKAENEIDFYRFLRVLDESIAATSPGGMRLSSSELARFASDFSRSEIHVAAREAFLGRWNRTIDYNARGIQELSDVPQGEDRDFYSRTEMLKVFTAAADAFAANEADGFPEPGDALKAALDRLQREVAASASSGAICARVRIRLSQDVVQARQAFEATLELVNESGATIEGVSAQLEIRDLDGNLAGDRVVALDPTLSKLSAINGTGTVEDKTTGAVRWLIVPGPDAARGPEATTFAIGGVLRYTDKGTPIVIRLSPVPVHVLPIPRLSLQYFHERDVRADDPFTDAIEPSIPYSLGVLVHNRGGSPARNLRITSSQPEIIENSKGLVADFDLIATEIAGVGYTPSLTASFGDVNPGDHRVARWLFRSSIQGQFIRYRATLEHLGPLSGRPELASIQEATIHELIHLVEADGDLADGQPDFLVNDDPDDDYLPDALYLSNGSTNQVRVVRTATTAPGPNARVFNLSFTATQGWTYLRVPDPSRGSLALQRVLRADGSEVEVGPNAWTTDRTFTAGGKRPTYEFNLHLLDRTAAGTARYTLVYAEPPRPDTAPPVTAVAALPATVRPTFAVSWAGSDDSGEVTSYDVFVRRDGAPAFRWLAATFDTAAQFTGEPGHEYAFHSVGRDRAGNLEASPAAPDTTTRVALGNAAPVFAGASYTLDEGQTLDAVLPATDGDSPADPLVFELGSGAPAGLGIGRTSGRLTWLTDEGTGPTIAEFPVIVSDLGIPPLSVTNRVRIEIREVARPPVVEAIGDRVIAEGQLLEFDVVATDPDIPALPLQFSLIAPSPTGISIDASSGRLRWRPTAAQGPSTNTVRIRVAKSTGPATTASFSVRVRDTQAEFTLGVGSTRVDAGESGSVAVQFNTPLDVDLVEARLNLSRDDLATLELTGIHPAIGAASLIPAGDGLYDVSFLAAPGQSLAGLGELARLRFGTDANASSAFVHLRWSEAVAHVGIEPLRGGRLLPGRITVMGPEPLLDAAFDLTLGRRRLFLHGHPGIRYRIERQASLGAGPWLPSGTVDLQGESLELPEPVETESYYRAVRGN
jgi:hypothetical protein